MKLTEIDLKYRLKSLHELSNGTYTREYGLQQLHAIKHILQYLVPDKTKSIDTILSESDYNIASDMIIDIVETGNCYKLQKLKDFVAHHKIA